MTVANAGLNGTDAGGVIRARYARGQQTRILALTFPDLSKATDALGHVTSGIDCWELRADFLSPAGATEGTNSPPLQYVEDQIRFLKSHSTLPILFSLKTESKGGRFPDGNLEAEFELVSLAINLQCDYIQVSHSWPREKISQLVSKAVNTKIVGSHDEISNDSQSTDSAIENLCGEIGQYADIISLNFPTKSIQDCCGLVQSVAKQCAKIEKPVIAVGTGPNGRLSRFTAAITRVTHPSLPVPASPDYPTVAEVNQALNLLGQIPNKKFYIFGHNISHSLSPALHNAGFQETGLPHFYRIHQSESVDESVEELIAREDFGGASVTYPHKLQVGRLLDSLSPVAEKVGAVNTIVVRTGADGKRILIGDNTDWLGIKRCMDASLIQNLQSSAAIVLGAGGAARAACYAIEYLGIPELIIVNRTRSKAEALAASFTSAKTTVYETLEEAASAGAKIRAIVACVPADDLDEDKIPAALFAEESGVLVEMAYRPQVTGMMKVAAKRPEWKVYRGIDVLEEQAYGQFELWTQTTAPCKAMGAAMRAKVSAK